MKIIVPLTACLLASSMAFAQTTPAPAQMTPASPAPQRAQPAQTSGANDQQPSARLAGMQQTIKSDMQHAGFTDVNIMPDSFLVQAKDRSGNPVTMIVGPASMTAIVDQPGGAAAPQSAKGGSDGTATEATPSGSASNDAGAGSEFTTVMPNARMSSEIVGLDVYNASNQDIGTIKDIAYSGSRITAYIVAVGGFLGIDNRYVAVAPSDLKVAYDPTTKKWHASMDATADQLKGAPAFTYAAKT